MNVLEISWRNVRRNGRRSLLTLSASAVGALAILVFGGYASDNERGLQVVTVRSYGHLEVVAENFLDFGRGDPARFSIRDYQPLIDKLRRDPVLAPMLALVTPKLHVEGVAGNFDAGVSSNFSGDGVVPSEYALQLAWNGLGAEIPPLKSVLRDDVPDGGAVGLGLAQLLALCEPLGIANCRQLAPRPAAAAGADLPKDIATLASTAVQPAAGATGPGKVQIELLASSPGGLPSVVRMEVLEAKRQAVREIDSMFVAMPLTLSQRLVNGPDERAVSAIVIQLRKTGMLDAAKSRLREILKDIPEPLEVVTFHEVSPVYDQINATYDSIFRFIAVLMAGITLFSIANAVNMAVGERIGEIGTLRSLGFQRSTIRRIFVLEGALQGILGAAAGAAAAILVAAIVNKCGLTWTPPGRNQAIPLRIDILATPSLIAETILGLSLVACLSALWPANHAARLEVTEALRNA